MASGTGRLEGRTAIITGAGHGLGRAYAHRFADEGAKVVVAELDAEAGEKVAEELRSAGAEAVSVQTDVSEADSVEEMAARSLESFGGIDILVNNAAIFSTIPISRSGYDDISVDEWDLVMRVNLRGTWLACKAVLPTMREAGYGKIVNISSDTAFKNTKGRAHYIASKAGVAAFTRTLSVEVGPDNVHVNCVAPGKTLAVDDASDEVRQAHEAVAATQSIPGMLRPEHMTGTVLFLASSDSDFITGQTILVNGGAS